MCKNVESKGVQRKKRKTKREARMKNRTQKQKPTAKERKSRDPGTLCVTSKADERNLVRVLGVMVSGTLTRFWVLTPKQINQNRTS